MRKLYIVLALLLLVSGDIESQETFSQQYVLFKAERFGSSDANGYKYGIYYGSERGILPNATERKVYAIYDSKRPLNDLHVGTTNVIELEAKTTILSLSFKDGFKPTANENLLIDLSVQPLNRYYQSIVLDIATLAITYTSIDGSTLLDFENMRNDGISSEHEYLTLIRRDVSYTSKKMRKQMAPQTIQVGRYSGQDLFDAMKAVTVEEVRNYLLYVKKSPKKFIGKQWIFSEVYATWLLQ